MDKDYVVIARFDDETDEKLNSLRKRLQEKGYIKTISDWSPHITIAAYEGIPLDALLQWTDDFAKKYLPFDVSFSSLGIFPPTGEHMEAAMLFASPSQSKYLMEFYYAFHEKLDEYCGNLGWLYSMKFGHPAIHSTIGIVDVVSMQKAIEMILEHKIFEKVTINALEIYTYPMELVQRFELEK